jgi:ribokinase
MQPIVVIGSINMDVVTRTAHLPRPGETVAGRDLAFIPGGKGENQAIAASRLGGHVKLVGKLGKDAFGDSLLNFLRQEILDLAHVAIIENIPTGTALIVVDDLSENTIVVIPGANAHVSPADVENISFVEGGVVVTQLEIPIPTIVVGFQKAKQAGAGVQTILNTAPALPIPDELLILTDYLIMNEIELAFFAQQASIPTGSHEIAALARQVRATSEQKIIVTLGRQGALYLAGDEVIQLDGFKVDAVDTTGAGDCFVGAFAVALAEGKSPQAALQFANAAAALSVQKFGATAAMPYRAAVEAIITNGSH